MRFAHITSGVVLAGFLAMASVAGAATNITSTYPGYFGWNDAIGWLQFNTSASTMTVNVLSPYLQGYASSTSGVISLDCNTSPNGNICAAQNGNYQVFNDGSGSLSGWAWNDAIGWISFCGGQGTANCPSNAANIHYQVTIDGSGNFHNYAWNDLVGWISFNCADSGTCGASNYFVNTLWRSTSTSGTLDSTTFDMGPRGGQPNSFTWKGTLPASTLVGFQFALSNATSGPWNYFGPSGTASDYFISPGPGQAGIISTYDIASGFRYFRYRIYLQSNLGQTLSPVVDEVFVNWSP